METVRLTEENLAEVVARASVVLRSGGIILYPTDTLYGLGADALSDEAVTKIYAIKGRKEEKPIHGIVSDITMAQRYGEMNDTGRALAERFFPGPFTLILTKREEFNSGILHGIDTFGFRIPANDFCIACAKEFGGPFTGTSANRSGEKPERSLEAVLSQLGENASLVDLIIDAGELPESLASTVVDVSSGEIQILREGAISSAEISQV